MNSSFRLELDLHPRRVVGMAVLVFLSVWPWLPFTPFSVLGDAILAAEYAIVAISLVLLIGWVGQISIAQAALVGVGAYTTALIVHHLGIAFPANLPLAAACSGLVAAVLGAVALRVRGLYLAVATLIFGYMADEFLFHQTWFSGYGGEAVISQPVIGHQGYFPSFDFTDRRVFYYVAWACVLIALYATANLRSSKTGRAFFAVRGSEVAAASLGVNVTRYKLVAFVISGVLAGVAGNLIMVGQQAASADQFNLSVSIFYLSVAVVGGLTSLGGALVASLIFAGLNEAFLRIHALNGYLDITSAILLALVLLSYPGGLGAVPDLVRGMRQGVLDRVEGLQQAVATRRVLSSIAAGSGADGGDGAGPQPVPTQSGGSETEASVARQEGVIGRLAGRLQSAVGGLRPTAVVPPPLPFPSQLPPAATVSTVAEAEPSSDGLQDGAQNEEQPAEVLSLAAFRRMHVDLDSDRQSRQAMIEAVGVTVRFGGLVANDDVSFAVHENEIVGLIGPNGAGKTTLFNAVAGLNQPAAGSVRLIGQDVTNWPVHARARLGVGRTFQAIQLFNQLTVFENLMVATHNQNGSGVFSHIVAGERSIRADLAGRERVTQVLGLLGLRSVATRTVRGLPFGTLRMVEVARAIVTGARVIMLDEPASGLDNTETERLGDLLLYLRGALGMTLLVIEHDVPFVTSVSDYMYVLDRGRLLAEGRPSEVQRNEAVVAAYLGGAHSAQGAVVQG